MEASRKEWNIEKFEFAWQHFSIKSQLTSLASYSYFCSMTGEKKSLCGNDWLRQRKEIAVCPLGWGREGWEGAEASTDCGRQINRKGKKLKVKNPEGKKNAGFDNEADKRRNTITTAGNWRGWGKLHKLRWKVGKGLEMNYRQPQKRGTRSIGRSFSWEPEWGWSGHWGHSGSYCWLWPQLCHRHTHKKTASNLANFHHRNPDDGVLSM